MSGAKLLSIFFLAVISVMFFYIKVNAQCSTNCGDCSMMADCTQSLALPNGCEWNPGLPPLIPSTCAPCSKNTEVSWPASPLGTHILACGNITTLVQYVYEWGIFFGGLAAFIAFVIGGLMYLTSAGDPGKMKEGRDRIFTAATGLILLFSIFLILNTINPELTILTIPSSGMGATCDINTDCCINPANCPFKCDDPNPGDGNKQGSCLLDISAGCDTTADCPVDNACQNDPTPGDGKKEGMCIPICKNVTLYSDINYGTAIATYTPADGCKTITTVGSVSTTGSCSVSLYKDTADCNAVDPTGKIIILSGSVADIATNYAASTTFQSVQVKDSSF